jgi:hypothetical protein
VAIFQSRDIGLKVNQPKISEILQAAAVGYLFPYERSSNPFDAASYYQAKCVASALNMVAELYAAYERANESEPPK